MTSFQCVEAFSPAQPGEEQNHEEYGLQSGQYLHSWGGVVTGNFTSVGASEILLNSILKCVRGID